MGEGGGECTVGADGAAFSVGNLWIGTVWCILADHLVAHDGPAVADADLAGLRFPYILVVVVLTFQCTATERDCKGQQLWISTVQNCQSHSQFSKLRWEWVEGLTGPGGLWPFRHFIPKILAAIYVAKLNIVFPLNQSDPLQKVVQLKLQFKCFLV